MEEFSSFSQVFIVAIPFALLLLYMLSEGTLTKTAAILTVCVGVPSVVMYYVFKRHKEPVKPVNLEKQAFLSFESKSIDELFSDLQVGIEASQESYHILLYLRKKAHSNAASAVELVHLGILQHAISILQKCPVTDKRYIACFDLINEILHIAKAREQLICNEYQVMKFIDALMDVFFDINMQLKQLNPGDNDGSATKDTMFVRDDDDEEVKKPSQSSSSSVVVCAEDVHDKAAERDLVVFLCQGYKILLSLGLLCSENHNKIQTRVAFGAYS